MNKNFDNFLETIKSQNTKKYVMQLAAIGTYDYSEINEEKLKQIILDMRPTCCKHITTICYIMKLYAKYLENDKLCSLIQKIDRAELWKVAKPNAPQKYISHSKYKEICHDIEMYEEYNSLYYVTLFSCVYEGIYNEDMSLIKNLRASDVDCSIVMLREDNGNCYPFEISLKLASDLKEMGTIDVWQQGHRFGMLNIKTTGEYPDSCFKLGNQKSGSKYEYRFPYYTRLRKIYKEYLGYNITPSQLFISGIMHRIKIELSGHNISLREAFSDGNRDRLVKSIIENEMRRCNYNIPVFNLRELVKGHIEVWDEDE